MGNINTEMYQALKLANVPEEQAIAAAEAVARGQDAATKSDLTEFAARLSSQMDIGFAEFRKETNERFEGIDERFEGIDEVLAHVRGDRRAVRSAFAKFRLKDSTTAVRGDRRAVQEDRRAVRGDRRAVQPVPTAVR